MTDFLIVPGRGNSGPGHWQSRWQTRLNCPRVEQRDWEHPDLVGWTQAVVRKLDELERPSILVAHSFGCFAAVAAAARRPEKISGLFLVAMANPVRFPDCTVFPDKRISQPAILITSRTDPWLSETTAIAWARLWGCRQIDAGPAGHINRESGHGDWDWGWSKLSDLIERAGVVDPADPDFSENQENISSLSDSIRNIRPMV